MWQLADDILDSFLARGEGEFIKGFAGPFTLRVIADLLGVPAEDRAELIEHGWPPHHAERARNEMC
jgi:cytochrome P450